MKREKKNLVTFEFGQHRVIDNVNLIEMFLAMRDILPLSTGSCFDVKKDGIDFLFAY